MGIEKIAGCNGGGSAAGDTDGYGLDLLDRVHLRPLDGFRGVAVLSVLCFHMYILAMPGRQLWGLGGLIMQGWGGVDLFFVLSGFLITGILLQARGASGYFRTFYTRRALRIFPLFYLVCAAGMFLYPAFTGTPTVPFRVQLWYWLNLSNVLTAIQPNAIAWADPFWSLAIEEQFYLLWPLLVQRWSDGKLALVSALALPGEYLLRMVPYVQRHDLPMANALPPQFSYRMTPLHTDGIFAGALLAIALQRRWLQPRHRRHLGWISAAGVALFWVATVGAHAGIVPLAQLRFTGLALFGAGLIGMLALSNGTGRLSRVFACGPLQMLGKRSFCIYLIHIPVWIGVGAVLHRLHIPAQPGSAGALRAVLLTFVLTLVLAAVSWKFFEEPILSFKRRFRYVAVTRMSLAQA